MIYCLHVLPALLTCIREVLGLNLGRVTECENKTAGLRFENLSYILKKHKAK
jgi:hypothetical protein